MKRQNTSRSPADTISFANLLAQELVGGEVILLRGDLGSGKTTFTQGLGIAIGIKKNIISPTFLIMRTYELPEKIGKATHFYHIDLYRTNSEKDIEGLGLYDLLEKKENIVAIEWPERLGASLPKNSIFLFFEHIDETTRKITIT